MSRTPHQQSYDEGYDRGYAVGSGMEGEYQRTIAALRARVAELEVALEVAYNHLNPAALAISHCRDHEVIAKARRASASASAGVVSK